MRERIFQIIEGDEDDDKLSQVYQIFMLVTIVISLVPLAIKAESFATLIIDKVTVVIFIADYFFRLITADYLMKKGATSFVRYPFSILAVIDLISILPSLSVLNRGFCTLKIARLLRTLRVFKIFKTFRYSKNILILFNVIKKQKDSLVVTGWLAFGYIMITALVIYNFEPDTFDSFFDAIYWATISLTTVGYGDIYTTSVAGRVITMISAILGIAIVALPAGIITAGYMKEVNDSENKDE